MNDNGNNQQQQFQLLKMSTAAVAGLRHEPEAEG
ncbi:hypothetical protein SOVF_169050 [Spinacia oleracea]|nr:hypothetical protein SOVF_169050 [Spinacia oleracea]